nr:hypothetical protein [Homoserinibacter gongjuensis]
MIGNAHLDPVWLWPWQEGYQEARATFRSVLDRMDEYPDFIFTCDQIVLLSWVEEQDPELFARIQERVAEGRWVNAGAGGSSPTTTCRWASRSHGRASTASATC